MPESHGEKTEGHVLVIDGIIKDGYRTEERILVNLLESTWSGILSLNLTID
jgi:hypothetical protein